MNSRKKNGRKKRKLGSLLLLLFLTIILLATSTYAWFTSNRNVSIDAINVTVATSSGIQISTDANTWKTLISNGDITTGYSFDTTDQDDTNDLVDENMFSLSNLVPVSTAGAVSSGKMAMYKGVIDDKDDDGVLGLTATVSPEAKSTSVGDFIAFDIFLKLDQAGTVYLDAGSGVTVTANKADKGAQYAARYAFIVEGNNTATTDPKTLAGYTGGSSVIMIEPNYDGHTAYGIEQARLYYQDYTYGTTANATYASLTAASSGNDWVSWDGVSGTITDQNEIPWPNTNATDNSTKFTAMTGNYLTRTNGAFSSGTGTPVDIGLSLSAGVTKIRVYLWIEGQDIDCDNSASGAFLTFNINFTLDGPTTP